jgi:poly-beta-1,6-N-acetyl-D-glucosamine synthase
MYLDYSNNYSYILAGVLLLQILMPFRFYFQFVFTKNKNNEGLYPPVSVVIAAKNEAENLKEHLPEIMNQNYPDFEVVVVDDQSCDDTRESLLLLQKQYSRLKTVFIEDHIKDHPGKKLALALGIKKAAHEIILLSDADCRPCSPDWISKMSSCFDENTEIVLGYSPYEKKASFLNLMIRTDTYYTGIQYLSAARNHKPYMGTGRNMAYRKELFMKKAFRKHIHVHAGDDDLFVNYNAHAANTRCVYEADSFMISRAKKTWKAWILQKLRHYNSGREYHFRDKFRLGLLWFSQALLYPGLLIPLFFAHNNILNWILFTFLVLLKYLYWSFSLYRLRDMTLLWIIPFLEILYLFIVLPFLNFISFLNRKNNYW